MADEDTEEPTSPDEEEPWTDDSSAVPLAGDTTPQVGDSSATVGGSTMDVGESSATVGGSTVEVGESSATVGDSTVKGGDSTVQGGDSTVQGGDSTSQVAGSSSKVGGDTRSATNAGSKTGTQKSDGGQMKKKRKDLQLPVVEIPPCLHEWCLGEVLRQRGLENGVCCPRPLPWGSGKLRYIPGWEKICAEYECTPYRYEKRKGKPRSEDVERWRREVKEAKTLWDIVGPILSFPSDPVYEDEEPVRICNCQVDCCLMKVPNKPALKVRKSQLRKSKMKPDERKGEGDQMQEQKSQNPTKEKKSQNFAESPKESQH